MSDLQPVPHAPTPSAPEPSAAEPPAPPEPPLALASDSKPGPLLRFTVGLHILALILITFAMTPYTYLLDEIKWLILLCAGPLLMLFSLITIRAGQAPPPTRPVSFGLAAYGLVLLVSTLTTPWQWAGWFWCLAFWANAGLFMAGYCAGSHHKTSWIFARGITIILLFTCIVGFLMYDVTRSPEHHSFIAWLYHKLYTLPTPGGRAFRQDEMPDSMTFKLLDTLMRADGTLQSTILNGAFYAGFCLILLPFALLTASVPDMQKKTSILNTITRFTWRLAGTVAAVLAVSSAMINLFDPFQCGVTILSLTLIAILIFKSSASHPGGFRRFPVIMICGLICWAILLSFILHHTHKEWPFLGPFSDLHLRYHSYQTFWRGAWGIFKSHPVLGGGPGSFVILFTQFRDPNYYLYAINNVTTSSHNAFLDVLSETGIFGLVAFSALLGAILIPGLRGALRQRDPHLRGLLLAASLAVLAAIACNLNQPLLRWPAIAAPIWSVMGLLAGLVAQAKRNTLGTPPVSSPETEPPPAPILSIRNPLVRDAVVAMAAVSAIILPLSITQGVHYWRSAKTYALGFSPLENASRFFAKGDAEPSVLIDLFTEASEYFEDALRQDPDNTSAYYKLGSAFCSLSQLEEQLAKEKKQKNPTEATRHQALADQYLDKAVKAYEDLARLSPDYAEIHYNLGIIYHMLAEKLRRQGLTDEATEKDNLALRHLLQMVRQSNKPEVAILAGQQLMNLERWDEALAILRAASDRNPNEHYLAENYLKAAQKVGKPEDITMAQTRIENIKRKKASKQ